MHLYSTKMTLLSLVIFLLSHFDNHQLILGHYIYLSAKGPEPFIKMHDDASNTRSTCLSTQVLL